LEYQYMRANFLSAGLPSNFSLEQVSPDTCLDLPVFHRARIRQVPDPTDRTATTKFSWSLLIVATIATVDRLFTDPLIESREP